MTCVPTPLGNWAHPPRRLEALPTVSAAAREGVVSVDRIWAVAKTAVPGEDDTTLIDECWRYGVDALSRLATQRHRLTGDDEQAAFRDRYLIAEPNLDQSSWKVYGTLPGLAGRSLVDALDAKADQLPNDIPVARTIRYAYALWAMSLDSLAGSDGASIESATPLLSAFMDACEMPRTTMCPKPSLPGVKVADDESGRRSRH